mgnify:CR=1 FL=1
MNITVVLGTARINRNSELVAFFIHNYINNHTEHQSELADVRDLNQDAVTTPPWGEGGADSNPTNWQIIVQKSDALIFVIPEYNYSFPGELKILLDSLLSDYKNKLVGLIGVSTGSFGGARAVEHIKPVLLKLGFKISNDNLYFPNVTDKFSDNGKVIDDETNDRVSRFINELEMVSK